MNRSTHVASTPCPKCWLLVHSLVAISVSSLLLEAACLEILSLFAGSLLRHLFTCTSRCSFESHLLSILFVSLSFRTFSKSHRLFASALRLLILLIEIIFRSPTQSAQISPQELPLLDVYRQWQSCISYSNSQDRLVVFYTPLLFSYFFLRYPSISTSTTCAISHRLPIFTSLLHFPGQQWFLNMPTCILLSCSFFTFLIDFNCSCISAIYLSRNNIIFYISRTLAYHTCTLHSFRGSILLSLTFIFGSCTFWPACMHFLVLFAKPLW